MSRILTLPIVGNGRRIPHTAPREVLCNPTLPEGYDPSNPTSGSVRAMESFLRMREAQAAKRREARSWDFWRGNPNNEPPQAA